MGYFKALQIRIQNGDFSSLGGRDANQIAEQLGGIATGENEITAPVPGGGEMTVRINRDGSLFIYDCTGSWSAARRAIAPFEPELNILAAMEKQRRAHEIWDEGKPIAGTQAERYL